MKVCIPLINKYLNYIVTISSFNNRFNDICQLNS